MAGSFARHVAAKRCKSPVAKQERCPLCQADIAVGEEVSGCCEPATPETLHCAANGPLGEELEGAFYGQE